MEIDHSPPLDAIAALMREYGASLGFELDIPDFEGEIASLPGKFAPPRGRLVLARHDGEDAGCIALRPIDGKTGEVKRLYVRDRFRGLGVGRALVTALIGEAGTAGYRRLRLDTLPSMVAARRLYESFGFHEIEAYWDHPFADALFFELEL